MYSSSSSNFYTSTCVYASAYTAFIFWYLTIFSVPRGKKVSLLLLDDLFHIFEIILNKAIFWPVVKIMGLSTSRCRCSWSKSAREDIQISNAMTTNYTEGCLRPQC